MKHERTLFGRNLPLASDRWHTAGASFLGLALTTHHEAAFPEPWAVSDAPHDFAEKLIEAIVGIEIVVTRLSGKWKVSRNQPPQNQAGVIQGLNASGERDAVPMAALVEAWAKNTR